VRTAEVLLASDPRARKAGKRAIEMESRTFLNNFLKKSHDYLHCTQNYIPNRLNQIVSSSSSVIGPKKIVLKRTILW